LVIWFALLTAIWGRLVATLLGLPVLVGVLAAAGYFFGVPLLAVHVGERFSAEWAERICGWHLGISIAALVVGVLVSLIALIWSWFVA
jgi:hypothetical protein